MKVFLISIFLILLCISSGSCFNSDKIRVKRSNETEGYSFKKVTDGVKSFGNKVSNVATKGYEELKNLFSKERKVGDYQLSNIDVRVQEEEDYEEVGVKKRPKREVEDHKAVGVNLKDQILEDMTFFKTTESESSLTINTSITSPIETDDSKPLILQSIILAPLLCPDGQTHSGGRCRTIV